MSGLFSVVKAAVQGVLYADPNEPDDNGTEQVGMNDAEEEEEEEDDVPATPKAKQVDPRDTVIIEGTKTEIIDNEAAHAMRELIMNACVKHTTLHLNLRQLPEIISVNGPTNAFHERPISHKIRMSTNQLHGRDPIKISLYDLINSRKFDLNNNHGYPSIVTCLEIGIAALYANQPGSIEITTTNSKTAPKKEVVFDFDKNLGMFKFDRTKRLIYACAPEESGVEMTNLMLKYLPYSIDQLESCATRIPNSDRVIVIKEYFVSIIMAHLEGVLKKDAPYIEPLTKNGDLFYYVLHVDQWNQILSLVKTMLTPVQLDKTFIEITPYIHSTWEEMLQSDHRLQSILKVNKSSLSSPVLISLDNLAKAEIADNWSEMESGAVSVAVDMSKPIERAETEYIMEIQFELSYRYSS